MLEVPALSPIAERVTAALDKFRSAMEADGGGFEVRAAADGNVVVELRGACQDCPSQPLTIQATIVPALREVLGDAVRIDIDGPICRSRSATAD